MRYLKHLATSLLLIIKLSAFSQVTISGEFNAYMNSLVDLLPSKGTEVYSTPNSTERSTLLAAVDQVVNGQPSTAHATLSTIDYQLTVFTDQNNGAVYDIIERVYGQGEHWGFYVFNRNPQRPKLFFQSPHSLFDGAGYQTVYLYEETGAYALAVNGTHRCNTASFSSCDGTTGSCFGVTASFRESDAAHSIENMFYSVTEKLEEIVPSSIHVQMHGFGQDPGEPDAYLSNSSMEYPGGIDYLSIFRDAFLLQNPDLSATVAHIDQRTTLAGLTNVTGRLVNGSNSVCDEDRLTNGGRFFHMEQAKHLRLNQAGWDKMLGAFQATFPIESDDETQVYIKGANFGISVIEGDVASIDVIVSIENADPDNATMVDLELNGDPADFDSYVTIPIVFAPGATADQTINITLTDDGVLEPTKMNYFTLANTSGGNNATVGYSNVRAVEVIDDESVPDHGLKITEIHADPSSHVSNRGDANKDGYRDASEDEFVEVVNTNSFAVDISGYKLKDNTIFVRHEFPEGTTLPAGGSVVVFGGGFPNENNWFGDLPAQVASSGTLSLTNTGDDIHLQNADGVTYDLFSYGSEAGDNQSITLVGPDFTDPYSKHIDETGLRFTPGANVYGIPFTSPSLKNGGGLLNLILNEVNADPAGDANGDLIVGTVSDEFVEFVNGSSTQSIDLSGYELYDLLLSETLRHTFPDGTILSPNQAIVLFAGGSLDADFAGALAQLSTSGALGLTNGGDQIILRNPVGDVELYFGWGAEGANDQSITRSPDLIGTADPMVQHANVSNEIFTPGTKLDGSSFSELPGLIINEVHADPEGTILGDADGNGTRDGFEDEFIEFVNTGSQTLDLSGYEIYDLISSPTHRHTIDDGTLLLPGMAFVVFGGGVPNSDPGFFGAGTQYQSANQSGFILNNGGDIIELRSPGGTVAARFEWGTEGGDNQSLNRNPDITGSDFPMEKHSTITEAAGALYSPGRLLDGSDFVTPTSIGFDVDNLQVAEDQGVVPLVVSIANESATTATTATIILVGGTGSISDLISYSEQIITFPEGSAADQQAVFTINDDDLLEGEENLTFQITEITGGNYAVIDQPDLTLTIWDNESFLVLNEIHADPADGIAGDANEDLTGNSSEDEFLEFVNTGSTTLDLSNYTIEDVNPSSTIRHTFPNLTTLEPGKAIVIFGGGSIAATINGSEAQAASSGSLDLNDDSETIKVYDNNGIEIISESWTMEGNDNQSLTRSIEMDVESSFVKHTSVSSASYSPGKQYDDDLFEYTSVQFSQSAASGIEDDEDGEFGTEFEIDVQIENPSPVVSTTMDLVLISGDETQISSYPKKIQFPSGSSAPQTITIEMKPDLLVGLESEVFVFELQNVVGGSNAVIGVQNTFTLTVTENDISTLSLEIGQHAFEDDNQGYFTLTTTTEFESATDVFFTVSGSATEGIDYNSLGTSISFPAETESVNIPVTTLADVLEEGNETIVLTLNTPVATNILVASSPDNKATLIISDEDKSTLTITSLTTEVVEGAVGSFQISTTKQFGSDVTVDLSISGMAVANSDFTDIASILFPANTDNVNLDIATLDDDLVEGIDNLIVTLTGTDDVAVIVSTNDSDEFIITDNDAAEFSIAVTQTAVENGVNGEYTITSTKQFQDPVDIELVLFGSAVGAGDFNNIANDYVFPANSVSSVLNVITIDDDRVEGDEKINVLLDDAEGRNGVDDDVQISISAAPADFGEMLLADDDVAELSIASNTNAEEDAINGSFTISTTKQFGSAVQVNVSVAGTAIPGTDYQNIGATVFFPANSNTFNVPVVILSDMLDEPDETVILTITGTDNPSVTVGTEDEATILLIDEDDPLPVELTNWQAAMNHDHVLLTWETFTELNNDYFQIEKSIDGYDFKSIGKRDGSGNSNRKISYQFKDKSTFSGRAYYRLKQVDFDGSIEYTKIIWIDHALDNELAVIVAPNPASSEKILLTVSSNQSEKIDIQLIDLSGNVCFRTTHFPENGQEVLLIPSAPLIPGVYIVNVIQGGRKEVVRVKVE